MIGQCFPFAAMAFVLGAVLQQVTVKLLQHVRGERNVIGVREHLLHDERIARDLLLIAGGEGLGFQATEQSLDLAVAVAGAFDARGGADALDGGDAAQALKPVGCEQLPSAPVALELVDLTDGPKHLGRDGNGVWQGREHGGVSPPNVHLPVQFSPFMTNYSRLA